MKIVTEWCVTFDTVYKSYSYKVFESFVSSSKLYLHENDYRDKHCEVVEKWNTFYK